MQALNLAREARTLLLTHRPGPAGHRIGRSAVRRPGGPVLVTAAGIGLDAASGELTANDVGRYGASVAASVVAAPATAAGMLWLAGAVGTTSTGTAIGSLSGAALTSSATAFWGGGAVAAGGGGVAVGSMVLTGGTIVVAAAAGYAALKLWDLYDPAQRDAFLRLSEGLRPRPDLTDATTLPGAALVGQSRAVAAAERAGRR